MSKNELSHRVLYVRGLSTTNLEHVVETINKNNTVTDVFNFAIKKKRLQTSKDT